MSNQKDNGCCGAQQQCCCKQTAEPKLDFTRPIETQDGRPVRVVAHGFKVCATHAEGMLVSVKLGAVDVLYIIPDDSTIGYGYTTGCRKQFRNAPLIETTEAFINFYDNGKEDAVWEGYDTLKEANDSNIFGSRSCVIHIKMRRADKGPWTVEATTTHP